MHFFIPFQFGIAFDSYGLSIEADSALCRTFCFVIVELSSPNRNFKEMLNLDYPFHMRTLLGKVGSFLEYVKESILPDILNNTD